MKYIYIYLIISLVNVIAIVLLSYFRAGWKHLQTLLWILPFTTPPFVAVAIAESNVTEWTMSQAFWYTWATALAGYAFNYILYITGILIHSKILERRIRKHYKHQS